MVNDELFMNDCEHSMAVMPGERNLGEQQVTNAEENHFQVWGRDIRKFQEHSFFNHRQALSCAPPRLLLKDPPYPNTQAFATKGPRTTRPPLGILVRQHHGPDIEDSSSSPAWGQARGLKPWTAPIWHGRINQPTKINQGQPCPPRPAQRGHLESPLGQTTASPRRNRTARGG